MGDYRGGKSEYDRIEESIRRLNKFTTHYSRILIFIGTAQIILAVAMLIKMFI